MPGTNHFYVYLSNPTGWEAAATAANNLTFQGMTGYLANVTSNSEREFLHSTFGGARGWIGAKRDSNGNFRWTFGAESGQSLGYSAWCPNEPNNWGRGEMYAEQLGCWNDNGGNGETFGAFVEFEPNPDPIQMPGSSHFYRFVPAEGISWETANVRASALIFNGLKGHLATVQTAEENQFITGLTNGVFSWLGGGYTDTSSKNFQWLAQPDSGVIFTTCSTGNGSCQNSAGVYSNWRVAVSQPDAIGEDKIGIAPNGQWDDFYSNNPMYGFVVEFENFILPIKQPALVGIPLSGEIIQAELGSYDSDSSLASFEWQSSLDGLAWTNIPASDVSLSADQMTYRVKKADNGKSLRLKVTASNSTLSKSFYSSAVVLQDTARYIQPHASLGYDRLCLIQTTTHNLSCQGASIPSINMQAQSVDSSVNTLCAVSLSGKIKCWLWGPNYLQDGTADSDGFVTGITGAATVANNYSSTCALILNGKVQCWGHYGWGIPGPNISSNTAAPVTIQGLEGVVQLEGGWDHTCALKATGEVYCWGRNDLGQLGIGYSNNLVNVPTKVVGLAKVTSISAERHHSCATTSNGKVWCWGDNSWGQNGVGFSGGYFNTPIEVAGISNARRIYSGGDFNCAVTLVNTTYCWGANNVRQSNPNSTNDVLTSPSLLNLENIDSMILGHGESCAVLTNGETRCWGVNQISAFLTSPSGSTFETEVNTFAPRSAVVKSVVTGDSKLSIQFDTAQLSPGAALQAKTADGSTCVANETGLCVIAGLTNLSLYSLEVRASSDSGSTNWVALSKTYIPHTPGLQIWFEDNNVKIDQLTKVNILDANPNSIIWLKNGSSSKFGVRTDESGSASSSIWLGKASASKVVVTSGKLNASKFLYSPRLVQLSTIVKVGKTAKVVVQYAMPGSLIQVQTSDGRTLNYTSSTAINSSLPVMFQTKGAYTFTVKVNGKDLGSGAVLVY
jgi:alpha-tubulin suppressor-like RCC1 family protein